MLASLLALLAVVSGLLMIWQWRAGLDFKLGARAPVLPGLPSIAVLKPVKGVDAGTSAALESWFQQAYPGTMELIFGIEASDLPARQCVFELLKRYPDVPARLVSCPLCLGPNRKVSNLIQMCRKTSAGVVVISDADVVAPPDLLAQLAQGLDDPKIGLVHCLYRMAEAPTPATRWEAFVVNGDFWSQVLQNQTLGPLQYGLGAAMALRRADLDALGGFDRLVGVLADDHHLGRSVVALGKRTRLCSVVVDCQMPPAGWKETWRHQLRWAVTIRVCQRLPFLLSILANGTFWPALWFVAAPSKPTGGLAAGLLVLRVVQGLSLEARFTARPRDWRHWWIVPFKDLAHVALWSASLFKRHVVWRGHRFRVLADGRLRPVSTRGVGA